MKSIVITFLLNFTILQLSAISFDGILITVSADTINCQILFSDSNPYAYKGDIMSTKKITVEINGEKLTYSADELTNYSILIGTTWKTYWGVNTSKNKYQFLKREVDGKLTLYSGITYSSIQLKYLRHYVFVKSETSDKLYMQYGTASNRQKLTQFIAECPVTTGLIYSREINIGDPAHWKLIAQKYNEEC